MGSNIHSGHRDRMRERFLLEGPDSFADHELLEMLLYGVIPRGNTNEIAHVLLKEFGSFSNLLESDPLEMQKTAGIGEKSAVFLSLLHELVRRYEREKMEQSPELLSIQRAAEYCASLLAHCATERFYLICLDSKRRVIHTTKLAEGTVDQVYVSRRMVAEKALQYKATGVVLCHNHPRGTVKPSNSDIDLTMRIKEVLDLLDILILDHIIIGEGEYYSFFQDGMLKEKTKK